MDNEDLLVNLVLDEAKSNPTWSHDQLFERLWSSLVKLRGQLGVNQDVADVFGLVRNQVPGYIIGCSNLSPFVNSFELMMRRLVKSVMVDDMDIQVHELNLNKSTALSPLSMIKPTRDLTLTSSRLVNVDASTRKTIISNGSIKNEK